MTDTFQPGAIVRGTPVGQKRRQTFQVTRSDADYTIGLLVSRKYPGNFRGGVTVETANVIPLCPSCAADLDCGSADMWVCTGCGDETSPDLYLVTA